MNAAYGRALEARGRDWDAPSRVVVSLRFCPPTKRRFDLDNALAAMKGAIDGLSHAIGVDDSNFAILIDRGAPVSGGAVLVEVR